jgi:hypothetical protein
MYNLAFSRNKAVVFTPKEVKKSPTIKDVKLGKKI